MLLLGDAWPSLPNRRNTTAPPLKRCVPIPGLLPAGDDGHPPPQDPWTLTDGKGSPRSSPTASLFGKCPAPSIATAGTAGLPSLLATSGTTPLTRDPHSQNFMVPATIGPLSLHGSPLTAVRGGWQGWFLSGDGGTDRSPSSPSVSEALCNLLASPAAGVQQGPQSHRAR